MKNGIHPDYKKTVIKCVCGNEIETGSVLDNITVEICSNCHPFYTGQQKILDSEGRVERFKKRYGTKQKFYFIQRGKQMFAPLFY